MDSTVFSETTARQAAMEFVTGHYPGQEVDYVSALRLGSRWLVEARTSGPGTDRGRLLMIVNRHGTVEELPTGASTRRAGGSVVEGLRQVNEVIDLRDIDLRDEPRRSAWSSWEARRPWMP